jgi:hypothetical protein
MPLVFFAAEFTGDVLFLSKPEDRVLCCISRRDLEGSLLRATDAPLGCMSPIDGSDLAY